MESPRHRGRSLPAALRHVRIIGRAVLDERRPLLAHIVPMRRCNLSCTYCNEYDDHSAPVPLETMLERVNLLAGLKTAVVTISGGEPLLHPELDAIIRQIHGCGMIATLITNGYKLGPERIKALNAAGLDHLQISIDNLKPDDVSSKSLSVLDRKLVALATHARFSVNINCVVGGGIANPEDALTIAARARELGFQSTMGIIHDHTGHLKPLSGPVLETYQAFERLNRWTLARINRGFQRRLANGQPNDWRCRAGSRYLYVCEQGLVHYCSQQRGNPAIPLGQYTQAHLRQAHLEAKPCAPYCTIACVHQASSFDEWRSPQHPSRGRPLPQFNPGAPGTGAVAATAPRAGAR
jgi:MoaA/NifB/PqqE/SkfB family radical SAM enzyme